MADAAAGSAAPSSGGGVRGKVENPTTVLILGLVTCGLMTVYWMWQRAKEVNDYLGEQKINPMFIIPGCLCPPLLIYVSYLLAKALPDVQKKAGVEAKDEFILNFLLLWFVSPVGAYLMQQKLNEVWTK